MSRNRVELLISGTVQAVGFRYFTYQKAQLLRLTGWVRNLPDGRVQVVAEGDRATLEQFIADLRDGPGFARVQNIDAKWSESTEGFDSFNVTR